MSTSTNLENNKKIGRRYNTRLAAVKSVYNLEINSCLNIKKNANDLANDIMAYYKQSEENVSIDRDFLFHLISGVFNHKDNLDEKIKEKLGVNWKFERLEAVIVAILRTSVFEILNDSETPLKIIINEYINITKEFYDEKEVGFINSVLDKIGHAVRD